MRHSPGAPCHTGEPRGPGLLSNGRSGSVLTLRQILEPIPENLGITLSLDSEGRFQGLHNPENAWIEASAAGALPSELLLNEAIAAVSSNPWPTPFWTLNDDPWEW